MANDVIESPANGQTVKPTGAERLRGTLVGRLVGGAMVSSLGFGITVLQAILQVPLLLSVWPATSFATWVVACAAHAFLISCDVGFHSFIGVETILVGVRRDRAQRALFSAAMRVWIVLSAVQSFVVAASWLAPPLIGVVWPDLALSIRSLAPPLTVFCIQWVLLGSFHSLVCRVLLAGGETVRFQWLGILHRSLLFLATVVAAWCGAGVFGVSLAYALAASASGLWCIVDVASRYPEVMPRWNDATWRDARTLFVRSTGLTLASMLEQSSTGGLTTIVAGTFQAAQVAAFSTMRSLANFVTQAAGVVLNPSVPELGRCATPEAIHRAEAIVQSAFIVSTAPLAAAVALAAPWIPAFYSAWTRHALPFEPTVYVGIAAAVLTRQIGLPLQYFLLATNRVKSQFLASAIRASALFATLPMAISWLGMPGVAAAILAAEICCTAFLASVTARRFVEYGGRLDGSSMALAVAHVALAATITWGALAREWPAWACAATAGIGHAALLAAQIRRLPRVVLDRVIALVRAPRFSSLAQASRRG